MSSATADPMPTVTEAVDAIASRRVSAIELLEQCLGAAERATPLNPFAHVDADGARAAAREVDAAIAAESTSVRSRVCRSR